MESGTVLHLALLKKLSNHYPSGQLCSRFNQFKRSPVAKCSPRSPYPIHRPSFEKYRRNQEKVVLQNSSKPRMSRMNQKFQRIFENWQLNQSVTAWNIENQQQVSYTEKLKRDKYDFFPKLLESSKKKNHPRFMNNQSIPEKTVLATSKLINILAEESKTEKNIIRFNEKKLSGEIGAKKVLSFIDKENEQLFLMPVTYNVKNRRAKSNDRSITASPMNKRVDLSLF